MFPRSWSPIALLAALMLTSCDSGNLFDPSLTLGVIVDVTAEPDPTIATSAAGETFMVGDEIVEFDWKTSFRLVSTIDEDQVQTTITSLGLLVQQATGGIIIIPPPGQVESFRFDTRTNGNIIAPGSSKVSEFDLWYSLPNGGREAVLTVSVTYINDSGLTRAETAQLRVAP